MEVERKATNIYFRYSFMQSTTFCLTTKMEKTLEKSMDETFRVPGVAGVLCADEHGLCLSSKGIAKKEAAGQLVSLARQAQQLHPTNPNPVIAIEAEGGTVLIKNDSDVTMAVYKSPMS